MYDTDDEGQFAVDVGRRLQQIRILLGLNQIEFAKAAGLKQNRYNAYETGARLLTLKAALLLCQKYPIDCNFLYMGDPSGLPHKYHEELRKLKRK